MIAATSKALFHTLAGIDLLRRVASRYGMAPGSGFARRFIAGETTEEALDVARTLGQRQFGVSLDYLGESVATVELAAQAARDYVRLIESVVAAGVERNVSLKLTQLGLDVDRATAVDNLRRVLEAAAAREFFVRIDMENSPYTEATIEILETLRGLGFTAVGTVIQSCLLRSPADVDRLNRLGARVRLVKGAYREPKAVAHHRLDEVNAAFIALAKTLLDHNPFPAIATHDPALIDAVKAHVAARDIDRTGFEFQMLYGIRRDLQGQLLAEGYKVRIYVPFGRQWFPYFMRRLGERPANVAFVLRSLLRDRG
ncbi:MAG: proline dehydrogenase family protein [Acidobacteria bacterium]|nr:proline dehydrogenase family protein [Acidobacteriota bacterium]